MTQYINLYTAALRRETPLVSVRQLAVTCAIVLTGLIGWGLVERTQADELAQQAAGLEVDLKAAREQLAALGKELSMRKPDAALAAELAGAQALLAARHDVLAALERGDFGNPGGFSDYLRAFSRQAVPGLWLTGFDVSGGGAEMAISGRAVAADLLPQYIRRLNGETVFRGRNFAALKMNGGEDKPAIPQDGTGRPPPEAAAAPHFVEFNLASANVKSATEEGMR